MLVFSQRTSYQVMSPVQKFNLNFRGRIMFNQSFWSYSQKDFESGRYIVNYKIGLWWLIQDKQVRMFFNF